MSTRPSWPYAVFLIAWGNATHPFFGATARLPGGSWADVLSGTVLIAVSLIAARAYGLRPRDLGVARGGTLRGASIGALAGVVALAGVGVIRLAPLVVGRAVVYEPLAGVSNDELIRHLAFFLPFGAVLPEELAFRGTLLGALARRHGRRVVLVGSAAAFALWHGAVIAETIGQTTLAPPSPWSVPAMLGAFAVVFGGGLLFAVLRVRTGSLASTIVAHWIFNAVILVGLHGLG